MHYLLYYNLGTRKTNGLLSCIRRKKKKQNYHQVEGGDHFFSLLCPGSATPGSRSKLTGSFSSLVVYESHTVHASSDCVLLIDEVLHLNTIKFDI